MFCQLSITPTKKKSDRKCFDLETCDTHETESVSAARPCVVNKDDSILSCKLL